MFAVADPVPAVDESCCSVDTVDMQTSFDFRSFVAQLSPTFAEFQEPASSSSKDAHYSALLQRLQVYTIPSSHCEFEFILLPMFRRYKMVKFDR